MPLSQKASFGVCVVPDEAGNNSMILSGQAAIEPRSSTSSRSSDFNFPDRAIPAALLKSAKQDQSSRLSAMLLDRGVTDVFFQSVFFEEE